MRRKKYGFIRSLKSCKEYSSTKRWKKHVITGLVWHKQQNAVKMRCLGLNSLPSNVFNYKLGWNPNAHQQV
jgi:hypothetical protein